MLQIQQFKMTAWLIACFIAINALIALPSSAIEQKQQQQQQQQQPKSSMNATGSVEASPSGQELGKNATISGRRLAREVASSALQQAVGVSMPVVQIRSRSSSGAGGGSMGDLVGLEQAVQSHGDLTPAAGEHKKYILVKKKPKHKKIKMEIYKPKMKYKKIKMKVPVKVYKKKKIKGYLVKKEKHHHHY